LAGAPEGAGGGAQSHLDGVVPGGGVPTDGDRLAAGLERDGVLDSPGRAVAGLPGAEDLFGVLDRGLTLQPGIAFDDPRRGRGGIGGDQRQVIAVPGAGRR
jgi:hypothetical protein